MSDLDSLDIAGDNRYSELRHQFFVWRNLICSYDYIGFEHYRRPSLLTRHPWRNLFTDFPDVREMRLYFCTFNHVGLRRIPRTFGPILTMRRSLDHAAISQLRQ